jgi:hypothetical protein
MDKAHNSNISVEDDTGSRAHCKTCWKRYSEKIAADMKKLQLFQEIRQKIFELKPMFDG